MAKRKKELDNIGRDVVNAMALGYGVHYGNYKADYPNTRDMEPEIPVETKPCLYCGAPIRLRNGNDRRKLYCNDACREGNMIRRRSMKGG